MYDFNPMVQSIWISVKPMGSGDILKWFCGWVGWWGGSFFTGLDGSWGPTAICTVGAVQSGCTGAFSFTSKSLLEDGDNMDLKTTCFQILLLLLSYVLSNNLLHYTVN